MIKIKDFRKKVPAGNFKKGRVGWLPGLITLHTAEGSFDGTCEWFCNPESGVSSHFVIGPKGEVAQFVALGDTAYVNGTDFKWDSKVYYGKATNPIVKQRNTNANNYTIGIEFAGHYDKNTGKCTMTAEQEQAAIELIANIVKTVRQRFGNTIPVDRTRICGHYEVNPITKPFCGKGFPYDRIIKGVIKMGV
nr:MAG TPA: N-acetylmuramoyl-L-alanine amidase [Caudoviricetes sp.]